MLWSNMKNVGKKKTNNGKNDHFHFLRDNKVNDPAAAKSPMSAEVWRRESE